MAHLKGFDMLQNKTISLATIAYPCTGIAGDLWRLVSENLDATR